MLRARRQSVNTLFVIKPDTGILVNFDVLIEIRNRIKVKGGVVYIIVTNMQWLLSVSYTHLDVYKRQDGCHFLMKDPKMYTYDKHNEQW